MPISRTATVVVAAAGLAIAAGVGYGLHITVKKRNEQRAVVSVVGETTTQLRTAWKSASPHILEKIEGNLRVAKSWSNPQLSLATEHYLIGAREILRRRAEADRLAKKAAASRAALSAHMKRAAHRDQRWIRTATDLQKQAERDHLDLDRQLKTLADLLDSFSDSQKRLTPHVEASLLFDDGVRRQAYREVLEEAKRASAEMEKARNLLPR